MKVALVVMPLAASDRPSLAAGLLQASLRERGVDCRTKYFNVTLARMLGEETYRFLAESAPTPVLAGEWVFSQILYGEAFSTWDSYRREVLDHPVWGMRPSEHGAILALKRVAGAFLRAAFESSDWGEYDLVGFTSTFEQTLPALCLASMIKRTFPHVAIALGGANFEAGMGRPYVERFPFVDFVCTGEGEHRLAELCDFLGGKRPDVPEGFYYRDASGVALASGARRPFTDLDALPVPDFDDFHRVHVASRNGEAGPYALPLEASRGCWWGEKAHCTFCGLNGEGMTFRRKSWRRVAHEVETLAARYRPSIIQFADNILGLDTFGNLIPYWEENPASGRGLRKFFEVKSNLKRGQVEKLSRSGVDVIQAGIESFSDDSLKLMRKGVTGAQNAAILRWAKESGVIALWNLIFGFPKEKPESYAENVAWMGRLTHVDPPNACAPIRMDRFSPNFTEPSAHGFANVRPMTAYRHVFPFPGETLADLATYFDYDHPGFAEMPRLGSPIGALGEAWREKVAKSEAGTFALVGAPWRYRLLDTRFNHAASERNLSVDEIALLLACDAPVPRERALDLARSAVTSPDAAGTLERLVAFGAIAESGAGFLTLPLLPLDLRVGSLTRAA